MLFRCAERLLMKTPPTYAIASVDHALRLATMLRFEGSLRVAEAAERLGVAQSTAHRLLQMLVYRDFAVQDETRVYRAGPVRSSSSPRIPCPGPRCSVPSHCRICAASWTGERVHSADPPARGGVGGRGSLPR
ncbi:helix-turn-helix domain-containing protein [Streptomyces malaysiensis]|uniref:helix-turn-helix domain-containing protein n=1 Tax=Streptomyces malaysiensis TaxID=92644 RepID=UPI0035591838